MTVKELIKFLVATSDDDATVMLNVGGQHPYRFLDPRMSWAQTSHGTAILVAGSSVETE